MTKEEETTEEEVLEETTKPEAKSPKRFRKKVVRRRKSKKEKENPLTAAIRLAVESGKVDFGYRSGLSAGQAKLFVVAANVPAEVRTKIVSFAEKSSVSIFEFPGTTMDLGSVCGKPFPVSVLSVFDQGSSNLLSFVQKK